MFFYCKFMEQTAKIFNMVVMECNDSAKLNAMPPQKATGRLCLSHICEYTQAHHTIFAQDAKQLWIGNMCHIVTDAASA